MNSDYITSVPHPDTNRVQGMQTATTAQSVQQAKIVAHTGAAGRNESAAGGQNLPLNQAKPGVEKTSAEEVETAVSQISDFVQNFQRDLQFTIDKESERMVVKVVDSETKEVIRQIPSEETLRIARNLDSAESLILREQA
jgi:flagellar protein FlaG